MTFYNRFCRYMLQWQPSFPSIFVNLCRTVCLLRCLSLGFVLSTQWYFCGSQLYRLSTLFEMILVLVVKEVPSVRPSVRPWCLMHAAAMIL